jgi:hypothetical protein
MPMAAYPTGTERCNTLRSATFKLDCIFSLVTSSWGSHCTRRVSIFSLCAFWEQERHLGVPLPLAHPANDWLTA